MHEMAIAESILQIIEQELEKNNCTKLNVVHVRYGTLSQIVGEALQFCFEAVIKDGPYEGARLELEEVDLVLRCGSCEQEFRPSYGEVFEPCTHCNANLGHEVITGKELYIQHIEAE